MFSKKAFTLAEVLVTLGIIGIVAAMTLPEIIQDYREKETVTRVKKFYSVFSQAYTQAVLENGTIDTWGLTDSSRTQDDDGNDIHSDESVENYDKFFQIIKPYLKNIEYKKINSNVNDKTRGYVMPDGNSIIGMWLLPSECTSDDAYCGDFYLLTDNKYYSNKEKREKLTFAFVIRKHRIEPFGTDNNTFKNYCLNGSNYSRCTGWVIVNGNMDYLHCADLDYNTKTKCSK